MLVFQIILEAINILKLYFVFSACGYKYEKYCVEIEEKTFGQKGSGRSVEIVERTRNTVNETGRNFLMADFSLRFAIAQTSIHCFKFPTPRMGVR